MTHLKFSYTKEPHHFEQDLNIGKKVNFFIKNMPPAFTSCQNGDYFFHLAQKLADWQHFNTIVVIGMGGSTLGAQTLCQTIDTQAERATVLFADNTDSARFILPYINLETTGVLVISKSGNTSEVLLNAKQFIKAYQQSRLDVRRHFTGITEEKGSELRALLTGLDIHTIPHHAGIGGRYGVLSIAGLLPAALGGLDTQKLVNGAKQCLYNFCTQPLTNNAYHGAIFAGVTDKPNHVIMPYGTALGIFGSWYAQLWAESLGKIGKGTTPVVAVGASDQHATLQLYLDGPTNHIFTIIAPNFRTQTSEDMKMLAAQALGTFDALKAKGHDVRMITFDTLTEEVMGELLMHFMLETVMTSFIWQVNPYDQPAVEDAKQRTKEYLSGDSAYL
jgi:glucose-6-phosphate isomerase